MERLGSGLYVCIWVCICVCVQRRAYAQKVLKDVKAKRTAERILIQQQVPLGLGLVCQGGDGFG